MDSNIGFGSCAGDIFQIKNQNTKIKMKYQKSKIILKFVLSFCVLLFAFCFFNKAHAATLYFSPSSGNFTVGNILTVSVLVNTQGQAVNNSDAVINFPTELLDIVSVTKSGSIFSLWVEEPTFSNTSGSVSFNGGLLTPGFNGTAGKLLNIIFRVKKEGSASLIFSSGAVRANDGYGTDILKTKADAQFNLISEEGPAQLAPVAFGVPNAPKISSLTHPDSDKWYAESNPIFSWPVGDDITAVKLLVGKLPKATPIVLYTPPISKKTIEDLNDGTWYFHVRAKNDSGWGGTAHFKFQIDTQNPEYFDLRLATGEDKTDPQMKFIFDAYDELSGVAHYEIQIDGRDLGIWEDDGGHIYTSPKLDAGEHILIVKTVDGAGNTLTSSIEFNIEALEPPVITDYPEELESGEILSIKGKTYPDSNVVVSVEKEKGQNQDYAIKSDSEGIFRLVLEERLKAGVYRVWAEVIDERGAKSDPSEKISIIVREQAFIIIGSKAISLLAVIVPLLAILILILLGLWYVWYKIMERKKRIRKEVSDVERALHKAFDLLKEDIREQVKLLEKAKSKRKLTEEEDKIIKHLKKDLDDAEKFIKKEIKDIEREIN